MPRRNGERQPRKADRGRVVEPGGRRAGGKPWPRRAQNSKSTRRRQVTWLIQVDRGSPSRLRSSTSHARRSERIAKRAAARRMQRLADQWVARPRLHLGRWLGLRSVCWLRLEAVMVPRQEKAWLLSCHSEWRRRGLLALV